MNVLDIIDKKRLGKELSYKELDYVFNGYLNGDVADYQMSSLLMAICINGMTDEETFALTKIFVDSGDVLDFSDIILEVSKSFVDHEENQENIYFYGDELSKLVVELYDETEGKDEKGPGFRYGMLYRHYLRDRKHCYVRSGFYLSGSGAHQLYAG